MKKTVFLLLTGCCAALWAAPVESLTPNAFATPFQIRLDTENRFEFRIDTPNDPVKVRVRPQKMKIVKGRKYWIEPTVDRPFEVTAEKDGELILNISDATYQYVGIIPGGKSLLKNKNITAPVKSSLGSAVPKGNGLVFEKNAVRGLFRVDIDKNIKLESGKKYRLTFGYKCDKPGGIWNSFAYAALQLRSADGQSRIVRNVIGYHLRDHEYSDGYISFAVPQSWKDVTATLYVASEFPITMEFADFDLRESFAPMRNHPRHHGTANQYPPVISEKKLLEKLEKREPYTAKIVRYAERPMLEINGKRVPMVGYQGAFGPTARAFNEQGYPLAWTPLRLSATYRYRKMEKSPIWVGRDKYDFSHVNDELKKRLIYTPDQPVMLTISLYPYLGFTRDFPDAMWREHDGRPLEIEAQKGYYFHSITGETYRREVGKALRKLGEYLKSSPYAKNVVGFHFSDGGDGQWFPWLHSDWTKFHFDYSEESRREVISLLKKRYRNDINLLRKAWDMPNAEFDTLQIPKQEEWTPFFSTLLDPSVGAQKRLIDFGQVYEDALVNSINHLMGEFKAGFGKELIGTVYFPHDSTASLLKAENIDGIISVPFYQGHRALTGTNFHEQPAGSFRINDKILLTEIDHRSDYSELGCRDYVYDRRGLGVPVGAEKLFNQLRRDFALTLVQGQYSWILTIAGYNTWSEKFFAIMPEYIRAVNSLTDRPEWYDWGQIAFIIDFKAERNSGRSYGFEYNTTRMPRKAIMLSGVSSSDYLVEDIGSGRLWTSKIYIFADAQNLTGEQVAYIQKNYQKNGNVLVFSFGTGLNSPEGFEATMKKLSGMTVRKDLKRQVLFQYAEKKSSDPLAKGLGQIAVEKGDKIPLFYVDDPTATPLAWHESDPSLVAAAVKRHQNWTAVYLANGYFSPEFPRALAQEAKITPAGPLGDITLAGNSMIMVHAVTDGYKTVNLPFAGNLIDLTTGQQCAYKTKNFTFKMKAGETRWFKVRR